MEYQDRRDWADCFERWHAFLRLLESEDLLQLDLGFKKVRAALRRSSFIFQPVSNMVAAAKSNRRRFVLQVIQPGLAGLMDGSVSTLAPVFAAAYATHHSRAAFLVGLAASIGSGISMGFTEAVSDDGLLSGRGCPWRRGVICGVMTGLGGIGHTLPFLLPAFAQAMSVAVAVVLVELALIAWIRHRFMDTSLLSATFQVVAGGTLVFFVGIFVGSF